MTRGKYFMGKHVLILCTFETIAKQKYINLSAEIKWVRRKDAKESLR